MPTITIHNAETGEIETREMNAEELAQWELDKSKGTSQSNKRSALLAKLGISEEEAALLLS